MLQNFPAGVVEQIGWYVYLYLDPRNKEIFYVGKGEGDRVFAHLEEQSESKKMQRIKEIRTAGFEPHLEILRHNLPDEDTAYLLESAVIDLLGIPPLTNRVKGHDSSEFGRMTITQIVGEYNLENAEIDDPVLLIRINQNFYHGMSAMELYENTRGIWKLGERRETARYALAVYRGVVREVFHIESWHPAGSTPYTTRDEDLTDSAKWEFVGDVAGEEIRQKYLFKSVKDRFPFGFAGSVKYENC